MRRGIGVSHVQQQRQTRQQMAELGAQITAERIGHIADQLETLEKNLRELVHKHENEIKHDPVVRARFRQIADSIGVDLISSNTNIFSGTLGLGNFYYDLASKLVEVCMKERKFCGSYVPLRKVLQEVQRVYDRRMGQTASTAAKDRVTISEGDIIASLKKLHCLGAGYNVVTLSGVKYVQTTPDGVCGGDVVALLNFALEHQKVQHVAYPKITHAAAAAPSSEVEEVVQDATSHLSLDGTTPLSTSSPIGAAYVLGTHPLSKGVTTHEESILRVNQCIFLTLKQVSEGLQWPLHRAYAALQRSVQDGSVWVDYPNEIHISDGSRLPKPLSSTSSKRLGSQEAKKVVQSLDNGAVYWFVSLTTFAEKMS